MSDEPDRERRGRAAHKRQPNGTVTYRAVRYACFIAQHERKRHGYSGEARRPQTLAAETAKIAYSLLT